MAEVTDPDLLSQLNTPQPGEVTDPNLLSQLNAPMTWGEVGKSAVSHLGTSGANFVGDMVQPFIHPIETAKNLGNLGLGLLEKTQDLYPDTGTPLTRGHEQYPEAVGEFFKNRYGGMENFKRTLAEDPVGFAGDLSTIFTGGETALGRASTLGKVAGKAAELTNPVDLAVRGIQAAKPMQRLGLAPAAADADTLISKGVQLTPGQMVGGVGKWAEDAGTSIPLAGHIISGAKQRSIESFNTAVANEALKPLGPAQKLPKGTAPGHDTIQALSDRLDHEYDLLRPKMPWVSSPQFMTDLNALRNQHAPILGPADLKKFDAVIDNTIGPRGLRMVPITGDQAKSIESQLTTLASRGRGSILASDKNLGDAYGDALMAFRADMARQAGPRVANRLQKVNTAYAMYSRLREAASRRATAQGLFTPSDLLASIKSGDKSVGKGNFAKGDKFLQSFAETGQRVLPSTIADSGTPTRTLLRDLVTGGAGAYGAHALGLLGPIAGAGAVLAAPYSRPGMWALNRARGNYGSVARGASPYAPALSQLGRDTSLNPYAP